MMQRRYSHSFIALLSFVFILTAISSCTTSKTDQTTTSKVQDVPEIGSLQENGPKDDLSNTTRKPIQVSKEVFEQTFSAVEVLINNLNVIIRARDYSSWVKFLSDSYYQHMTAPHYLIQLSKSATLQRNNIVLKNLSDYFIYVVVPSRANLRLDDLVFISETEVEAIMLVGTRRVTLYRLIKIGDQWLIGPS